MNNDKTFYLPKIPGGRAKEMTVTPNFEPPFDIMVPRGNSVSFVCTIEKHLDFSARITIDIEAEPTMESDKRDLGVLLVSAEARP